MVVARTIPNTPYPMLKVLDRSISFVLFFATVCCCMGGGVGVVMK